MKTVELKGAWLDYWTGRANGIPSSRLRVEFAQRSTDLICVLDGKDRYAPSTDGRIGLKIIMDNGIGFRMITDATWMAEECVTCYRAIGPDPLTAAMRAFIGMVFGDTVPDESGA